jgi:hypothetical protein
VATGFFVNVTRKTPGHAIGILVLIHAAGCHETPATQKEDRLETQDIIAAMRSWIETALA